MKTTRSLVERGFTLVELMIVLAISAMLAIYAAQRAKESAEDRLATAAADNAQTVGKALAVYISNQTAALSAAAVSVPSTANLQAAGACGAGASCLPPTFQPNQWMGGWTMRISRVGSSAPYQFEALACTNNAWQINGKTRIDLIGNAVKKIGGQGGLTYDATGAVGNSGGWSAPVATYPFANSGGKLCYYISQSLTALDSLYLRTDGTNKMNATLQMNNNDINAAKDVTATGLVNANTMTATTSVNSATMTATGAMNAATMTATGLVRGGTVTSSGDVNIGSGSALRSAGAITVQAGGTLFLQPQANGSGSKTVLGGSGGSGALEAATVSASDKIVAVNDLEISTLTARSSAPSTVSVKSLLPTLVEVNSHVLTSDGQGIPVPACPAGGSARVFVIPEQARGTVTGSALWGSTMYASGPLGGPWTLYAKDANGASMTTTGGAPFIALGRTFCAF